MRSDRHTSRMGAIVKAWVGVVVFAMGLPAQAAPTPAPDNSLKTKDYLDAGVPPIDKAWTTDDYKKGVKALSDIAAKDATQLPRYKSGTSGELFAHLIAQKNIDAMTDKAVSVDERINMAAALGDYVPVFMLYVGAIKPGRTFDAETLELGGFLLRAELAANGAVDDFVAAHPDRKGNDGFKKMQGGFAQTAEGVIDFMMDKVNVRKSEAARFAVELKDVLPKLVVLFDPEAQAHIKAQLKEFIAKEDDKPLKAALADLLTALK